MLPLGRENRLLQPRLHASWALGASSVGSNVREAVEYEVIGHEGPDPLDAVAERTMSQVERDLLA